MTLVRSIIECPHCSTSLYYRVKHTAHALQVAIPSEGTQSEGAPFGAPLAPVEEHFLRKMVDEHKVFAMQVAALKHLMTKQEIAGDGKITTSTPTVFCPNCTGGFQIFFDFAVAGVVAVNDTYTAPPPPSEALTAEEDTVYKHWEGTALLQAFYAAILAHLGTQPVKPYRRFKQFQRWLEMAVEISLPPTEAYILKEEFGKSAKFFHTNGVIAIVVDDEIQTFMPKALAYGEQMPTQLSTEGRPTPAPTMEVWIRTKYGYVAGKGVFLTALRLESRGSYGNASKSQR